MQTWSVTFSSAGNLTSDGQKNYDQISVCVAIKLL